MGSGWAKLRYRKKVRSKNPHAVILGSRGGKKGGPARAAALSSKRRSEIASMGGYARSRGASSGSRRSTAMR